MNITAIIVLSAFSLGLGYICGKCFKGLNPFLIIIGGLVFGIPSAQFLIESNSIWLTAAFIIGYLYNYGNPFRKMYEIVDEARIGWMYRRKTARSEANNGADFSRQKEQFEDEINRQKKAAEEDLRRQAEELYREKERFRWEQEQAQAKAQEQAKNNKKEEFVDLNLNPKNFADACKILGVDQNASKQEFKKAYRHLSNVFHPDKLANLNGVLKDQAVESLKLINVAWATVEKELS